MSAEEQIAGLLAEHAYVYSGLRGVSTCACGLQFHGMPHYHRGHVAAVLVASEIGEAITADLAIHLMKRREAEAERDALRERLAKVEALHGDTHWCAVDGRSDLCSPDRTVSAPWPCDTRAALGVAPSKEGNP